jgi:hypothetical protein
MAQEIEAKIRAIVGVAGRGDAVVLPEEKDDDE